MANFRGLPDVKKLREYKKISPQYFQQIVEEYKKSNPEYYEKVIKPLEYGLPSVGGKGRSILAIAVSIIIAILGFVVAFFLAIER